jgi:ATP-dependent Clp protease adaptor protein ClpS
LPPDGGGASIIEEEIRKMTTESTLYPALQPGAERDLGEQAIGARGDQYSVLLHNDEVTPYDYVIALLGDLFMLSGELAEHIAVTAHTRGTAVVVVRPRSEAEKLVKVAHGRARREGFPLTFSLEQE